MVLRVGGTDVGLWGAEMKFGGQNMGVMGGKRLAGHEVGGLGSTGTKYGGQMVGGNKGRVGVNETQGLGSMGPELGSMGPELGVNGDKIGGQWGQNLGSVGGMWVGVNETQSLGSMGQKLGVSGRDVGWGQ